ncbi:MAG: cold shock domain-containing protein [Phycisphaerales bacterium]|nr:MAG: cold shock domain-containing protein [Phycisphaerales bacterium]
MPEQTDAQITNVESVVRWFDKKVGYGFIVGPNNQDVFVHYSVIDGEGFRELPDGAAVRYDAVRGPDGRWRATRVVRTDLPEIVVRPRRGYSRPKR